MSEINGQAEVQVWYQGLTLEEENCGLRKRLKKW